VHSASNADAIIEVHTVSSRGEIAETGEPEINPLRIRDFRLQVRPDQLEGGLVKRGLAELSDEVVDELKGDAPGFRVPKRS
jgi:hypothetical protein